MPTLYTILFFSGLFFLGILLGTLWALENHDAIKGERILLGILGSIFLVTLLTILVMKG